MPGFRRLRVGAEFAVRARGPRIFAGRVQAGARQVQPAAAGFEAGQDAQGLGVGLETEPVGAGLGAQGVFAVVPEWRMSEIVGKTTGLDHRRVGADGEGDAAPDGGHGQGMGEPVVWDRSGVGFVDLRDVRQSV